MIQIQNIKTNLSNRLIILIIISLAVSPSFALGDGNRNLFLISLMMLSPLAFIKYPIFIPKVDFPLVCLGFLMIVFPLLFHPETFRISTVLYSCLFLIYYMVFVRVLFNSAFTLEKFCNLIKYLLYAYCIVLIIQQICVLMGLPIFNVSNYSMNEPWKLNSLMSEPSHSARVISVLMYLFISIKKCIGRISYSFKEAFLQDKLVWLAFLWTTFTSFSTTAILFFVIVLIQFFNLKKTFSIVLLFILILGGLGLNFENKSIHRAVRFIKVVATLQENEIIKADLSAALRIVPTFRGVKAVGINTLDDWVGHGVDADQKMIQPLPTVKHGNAGSFFLWFNHGIIVSFLFWFFSFKTCFVRGNYVSILIWFLCIWMYGGLNNQIIWLVLVLLTTFKYLLMQKRSI